MLIKSLLRSVRQVSLTSWAALVFLISPFLSILIAPFCLLGFERFGVQWHVLLLSCLGAAALVVPQAGFFPFVKRLFASWRFTLTAVVFIAWLLAMGFVHGFAAQAESLLSAAMLMLMLPIGLYVALDPHREWRLADVALLLLLIVVALENLLLTIYFFRGLEFNQVHLNVLGPPRLFLNVRDGNFVALVQYLLALVFCLQGGKQRFSRLGMGSALWIASVGFLAFQPFFNAWLTQGRALLLCLFTAIVLLIGCGVRKRSPVHLSLGIVSLGSGMFAFAFYHLLSFQLASMGGATGFASLIERGSGGRFELWRVWLESGFSNSLWWGHGFGFLPEGNNTPQVTPHNLLIQLFADSGLSSVLMLSIVVVIARGFLCPKLCDVVCIVSLPIIVYMMLGSVLFWSAGIYAAVLLVIVEVDGFAGSQPSAAPFYCDNSHWRVRWFQVLVLSLLMEVCIFLGVGKSGFVF